jgi:peroxiredoxin
MKKITLLLWILAALLIVRLLVPVDAQAADSQVPSQITGENLVDKQPRTLTLDPAKTYAIVFLSAVCPCSNSHLTELKNLAKEYPNVEVIGVHSNLDESLEKAEAYFGAHELNFPVIQDKDNALADALGAFKTPHSYVVSAGKIVYRGGVSDHQTYAPDARKYLREALEDLKQNRPVKTATTRTLGCAIPRS